MCFHCSYLQKKKGQKCWWSPITIRRPFQLSLHSHICLLSKKLVFLSKHAELQSVKCVPLTCASLATLLLCRKSGGAVRVGGFHHRVVPHCATGHGGRLDVRAHRSNARRTGVLSGLAVRGQLRSATRKRQEEQMSSVRTWWYMSKRERLPVWLEVLCFDN